MAKTKVTKPVSLGRILLASVVLGLVVGVVGSVTGLSAKLHGSIGLSLSIGTVVSVLALLWWRRSDEGVREAHKWAWYWGGSRGMALSLALALAVVIFKPEWVQFLYGTATDTTFIAGLSLISGMGVMMLMSLLGYVIAWVVWWRRHS